MSSLVLRVVHQGGTKRIRIAVNEATTFADLATLLSNHSAAPAIGLRCSFGQCLLLSLTDDITQCVDFSEAMQENLAESTEPIHTLVKNGSRVYTCRVEDRLAPAPVPVSAFGDDGSRSTTTHTLSTAEATQVHHGFTCDFSGKRPIVGPRYHRRGSNIDLCHEEFRKLRESDRALFDRIDVPLHPRVRVPSRPRGVNLEAHTQIGALQQQLGALRIEAQSLYHNRNHEALRAHARHHHEMARHHHEMVQAQNAQHLEAVTAMGMGMGTLQRHHEQMAAAMLPRQPGHREGHRFLRRGDDGPSLRHTVNATTSTELQGMLAQLAMDGHRRAESGGGPRHWLQSEDEGGLQSEDEGHDPRYGAADYTISADRLPTRSFKGTSDALKGEDASCAICLSEYDANDELKILPCLHTFHSTCVTRWLGTKSVCPVCKAAV